VNPLAARLAATATDLAALEVPFALVGGLAVSVRAEPRFTRDADLAVAVDDDSDAERVIAALRLRGYEVIALVEQLATHRLATVRLEALGDEQRIVTDLLFASSGIEPEIVSAADALAVIPGLVLPVASVGHLIATKLLARDDRRRPADADDLRSLATVASDQDWSEAEDAVALIEHRGFHRNRDLAASLRRLRELGAF
jgi:predicted nucleotidyltransferase